MAEPRLKHCRECGEALHAMASLCPNCGAQQRRDISGTKIAAGLCAILLGSLGVHKFILGANTAGIIMLAVSVLTCGIGGIPMGIIGIAEGIIYLCKQDDEFDRLYVLGTRDWF